MNETFVLCIHLAGPTNAVDTAAALAAWDWNRGREFWMHRADPPGHPYDVAC